MTGTDGCYTIDEARADAREWIKGVTVHDGTRGWRVCCALLEGRIAELEDASRRVVCMYRDGDATFSDLHPTIDNLRRVLGMSAVPDDR